MNTLQNLILSNEDETLNREVKAYQEKLTSKTNEIPIWERQWLTIEEASEYSGIARRKLRELSNTSGCPFAIWMGNKIHIIREKLDRYTETHNRMDCYRKEQNNKWHRLSILFSYTETHNRI